MHFEIVGTGTCTLLIVPGWRLDSETEKPDWLPILNERTGWRALFVDLPGTGKSRLEHQGVRTQRDIAEALGDVLVSNGLGRCIFALAGTSNGGALCLALAHQYRDRVHGLALRVPMLQPDSGAREVSGSQTEDELLDDAPAAYEAEHQRKVEALWMPSREHRTDSAFLDSIRRDPVRYGLAETFEPIPFDAPALVVLGRQDARVGWQRNLSLTSHFERGTIAVLDRAGHALPAGDRQTQIWQGLVHDWLDRVEEYAADRTVV